MRPQLVAIGSYTAATGGRGEGIALARVRDGAAEVVSVTAAASPSFVAWSRDGRVLFAIEETPEGAVSAYRLSGDSLQQVGRRVLGSARPCHIAIHPTGSFLAASCYGGGTVATLSIDAASGRLGPPRAAVVHRGRGPHPTRQDRPHPHSVSFTADGSAAVIADIGLDSLSLHRVVAAGLEPTPVTVLRTAPGSGPRHAAWLDEETLAVVEEISATISVLRVAGGALRVVAGPVATTRDGDRDAWPSEIAVADGSVLIANRRPGSLSRFTWSGSLTLCDEVPLPPANARHFAVDRSTAGRGSAADRGVDGDARRGIGAIWVALQDADAVVSLDSRGRVTGSLDIASPSCVAFRP
jgi:6-phosphogluconolactonase